MEKNHFWDAFNSSKVDFGKDYEVVIEKDPKARDGYEFHSLEEFESESDNKFCVATYYFKKLPLERNPMVVFSHIDGDDWDDRGKMLEHFDRHYALKFAVDMDGFF